MKAQFEAMGLAIVVVLISLGMFFLLFFSLGKPADFGDRYNREQLSQNVVDSMLKTQVEGCTSTIRDLIEDIVVLNRDVCGPTSKDKLDLAAQKILNATLTDRGYVFEFTITSSQQEIYHYGNCNHTMEDTDAPGKQNLTFFPSGSANVNLWMCVR